MHRPTLLLVDASTRAPARALGELDGIELVTAESGGEALDLLHERRFDAVIAGQRVPAPSGVALLAEVSRVAPGAERILMSAYGELDDLAQAVRQGHVSCFLPLPLEPRQVRALVARLGGHASARRRDPARPRAVVLADRDMCARLEGLLARAGVAVGSERDPHHDAPAEVLLWEAPPTPALVARMHRLVQRAPGARRRRSGPVRGGQLVLLPELEPDPEPSPDQDGPGALRDMVSAFERQVISETLARYGGNRTRAAKALGMTRQGLSQKLKKLAP